MSTLDELWDLVPDETSSPSVPKSKLDELWDIATEDVASTQTSEEQTQSDKPAAPDYADIRSSVFNFLKESERVSGSTLRDTADDSSGLVGGLVRRGKNLLGDSVSAGSRMFELVLDKVGMDANPEYHNLEDAIGHDNLRLADPDRTVNEKRSESGLDPVGTVGRLIRMFEEKGITDGVEMSKLLNDSIKENVWDSSTDDDVRVLSDGSARVNPSLLLSKDKNEGINAIENSAASAESKKEAIAAFPIARAEMAKRLDAKFRIYNEDYRKHASKSSGKTAEEVLFSWDGLDRNVIEGAWDIAATVLGQSRRNFENTVMSATAGALSSIGAEDTSASVARGILANNEKSGYVSELAEARGQSGLVLGTFKEAGTSAFDMVPMIAGGIAGKVIKGSSKKVILKKLGSVVGSGSVYGYAGLQGYASVMQTALQKAQEESGGAPTDEAIEKAIDDAQGAAVLNAAQTILLTKWKPGGSESLAVKGLTGEAGQISGREVLSNLKARYGATGWKKAIMDTAPEITALAKQVVKAGKEGFTDEAIEEGANQYLEGMITKLSGVDSDKTYDEIGMESFKGSFLGGIVGSGFSAVQSAVSSPPPSNPLDSLINQISSSGLPSTAAAISTVPPQPSGTMRVPLGKGFANVQVDTKKPSPLIESLLGPAPEGKIHDPSLDPAGFSLEAVPDGGGLMAVKYNGSFTSVAYDPNTGKSSPLPKPFAEKVRKKQGSLMFEGGANLMTKKDVVVDSALQQDAKVAPLKDLEEDDIDLSPPSSAAPDKAKPTGASTQPPSSAAPVVAAPPKPTKPPAPVAASPDPVVAETKEEVASPSVAVEQSESVSKESVETSPAGPRFSEARAKAGIKPDASGRLQAAVEAADGAIGASSVDAAETRYNPSSRSLEINAITASDIAIENATIDGLADKSDIDATALFKSSGKEAREMMRENHPDADDNQLGRLLVSAAINGNGAALAAIQKSGQAEKATEIAKKMADHGIKGELGNHVNKAVESFLKRPLAATSREASSPSNQDNSFSKEEAASYIQTEKGSEYVDSGPMTSHPTTSESMPIGSIVTTNDESGAPIEQRHVMFTESLPGGGVRHHLQRIAPSSSVKLTRGYAPNEETVTATRNMVGVLKRALTQQFQSLHPNDRATLLDLTRATVRSSLSRITSREYAKTRLKFGSTVPGLLMSWHNGIISVNENALLDQLITRVSGISGDNAVALDGAIQDYAQFLSSTVFHELKHDIIDQNTTRDERIKGVRDLVEVGDGAARTALLSHARTQITLGLLTREEYGSLIPGDVSQITDEEIMEILTGQNPRVTPEALDEIFDVIAHELLVEITDRMMTGTTYDESLQNISNWVSRFIDQDGNPKKLNRIQSIMARLIEMANRAAKAVSNFFAAHRLAEQLPPSLYDASLALQLAMEANGFTAPDVFNIRAKAMSDANDRLERITRSAKKIAEPGLADLQKELRGEIEKRLSRGEENPISIDPITGRLTSSDDSLSGLADRISDSFDGPAILQAASTARDLSAVLKHLNAGRPIAPNSKIVGEFKSKLRKFQELQNSSSFVRESVRRSVESATGMSESVLINLLNNAQANIYSSLYSDASSSYLDIGDLFISGDLSFHTPGARAANQVKEAENLRTDAMIRQATDPSPRNLELLNEADDRLIEARNRMKSVIDDLVAHSDNPKSGLYEAAALLKGQLEMNRRASSDAYRRHEEAKALLRPIRTIEEAMLFNARHPDAMDRVLREAGLADGRTKSSLTDGYETIEAIGRLSTIESQINYLAIGGSMPSSIKPDFSSEWRSINAKLEFSRRLMPLALGQTLRVTANNKVGAAKDVVRKSLEEPDISGSIEPIDGVVFSYSPTNFFSDEELVDPDFAKAFLAGDQFVATFSGGAIDANSALYQPLINTLASQVSSASLASSRLLGFEPGVKMDIDGADARRTIIDNTIAIFRPTINTLHDEHWRMGHNVSTEVMKTGGFAERMVENEDGSKRISFSENAIDIPDLSGIIGATGFFEAVQSSAIGDLLASTHDFNTRMEGTNPDETSAPVLSHAQGLTPAGLAYQLTAPKEVEFIALTKGLFVTNKETGARIRVDEMIIAASSDPDSTAAAYNSIPPDFENAPIFSAERNRLSSNPYGLISRFWDLHKHARSANIIRHHALEELHDKAHMRAKLSSREGEYRLPVSEEAMTEIQFEHDLRRYLIPEDSNAPKGTLVSLFQPSSAQELTNELLYAKQEIASIVGKGGDSVSGPDFYQLETEDSRNKDGRYDVAENIESAESRQKRDQQFAQERLERARYAALAAIFGGHRETIMALVHSPGFMTVVVNEDGDRVPSYHSDKLDSFILDKLEELRQEEIDRGTVIGVDGKALNHALDHDPIIEEPNDDDSISPFEKMLPVVKDPGGLRQRNPGFDAVIDSIINSGARVSRIIDPGLVPVSKAPGFDATPQSIMTSMVSLIPNITVIEGRARWEGASDYDGDEKIKPTVVFIPDKTNPTIIFPYGNGVSIDKDDAMDAVKSIVRWMGDHGGVDIKAQAKRILSIIRDNQADVLQSGIKAALRNLLGEALGDDPFEELLHSRKINSYALFWSDVVRKGIEKASNALTGRGTEIFTSLAQDRLSESPDNLFVANTNDKAATVIALALTHPQVKKILLLSTTKDPELPDPSLSAVRQYGNLASTGNIPGSIEQLSAAMLHDIPDALRLIDERGVEVESSDEEDFDSLYSHSDIDWEETFRDSGLTKETASEIGASPLMHQQMDWLNSTLYDVVGKLRPRAKTSILAGNDIDPNRGLTEMESRQLMATLSPSVISDKLAKIRKEASLKSSGPGEISVQSLMDATGEIAKELRAQYSKWAILDGKNLDSSSDFVARQAINVGPFSLMDAVRGEGTDVWHQTRIRKGAVRYAQLYGAEMMVSESGTLYASLEANPREMERIAVSGGWAQYTKYKNEDGSVEEVTIHEAAIRQLEREKARNKAILDAAVRNSLRLSSDLSNAISDYEAFQEASKNMEEADSDKFLQTINRSVSVESSRDEVGGVVKKLFDSRESLVSSMAESIVSDYRDYQADMASRARVVRLATGMSKLETDLRMISGLYEKTISSVGSQLIEAHKTLLRLEAPHVPGPGYSTEVVPQWYREIPKEERVRLLSARTEINRLAMEYNIAVAEATWRLNKRIPSLVEESEMALPYVASTNRPTISFSLPRHEMVKRHEAMKLLLSDIKSPATAAVRVHEAGIRHAVNRSKWYNPSDGVTSIDLSTLAFGDQEIEFSKRAVTDVSKVLRQRTSRDEQVAAVSKALFPHVFAKEEIIEDTKSAIRSSFLKIIDKAKGAMTTESAAALVNRISKGVSELSNIDSLSAHRIVLDVINKVNSGRISMGQLAVEQALRLSAMTEASLSSRRSTFGASKTTRDNGKWNTAYNLISLEGSPDDVLVARRILAKDGEIWSRIQQSRIGKSQFYDGFEDARSADMDADDLAELGAQAISAALREPYSVSGNLLVPDDIKSRVSALLAQKNGKQPTKAQVGARLAEMKHADSPLLSLIAQAHRGEKPVKSAMKEFEDAKAAIIAELKDRKKQYYLENKSAYEKWMERKETSDLPVNESISQEDISPEDIDAEIALIESIKFGDWRATASDLPQPDSAKTAESLNKKLPRSIRMASVIPLPQSASTQTRPGKVKRLMKIAESTGVFTPRKALQDRTSEIERALGKLGPIETMKDVFADVIGRLVSVTETPDGDPDSLFDKGRELDENGVPGPDLLSVARFALSNLERNPSDASIQEAFSAYSKIVAFTTTDKYLDHLVAGFVDSKVITGGLIRFTLHFNAKIRTAFARNLLGRTAARRILAITEYGPNGSLGFNRFEATNTAVAELMHKEMLKLSGDTIAERAKQGIKKAFHLSDRLQLSSDGYMFAAVKSFLQSGYGNDAGKAEALLRMFSQADDGLLMAINHTGVNTAGFKKLSKKLKNALTGDATDIIQQRELYRKTKEKFAPILSRVASGEIDAVEAIDLLSKNKQIDKRSISYGRFLESLFSSISTGAMASHVMLTGDRAEIPDNPIVPFSWIAFNKRWEESFRQSSIQDQLSVSRSKWFKPANRVQGHDGEVNLLDVNGGLAPMSIAKDMIYRTMVAPAYHVQNLVTGDGQYDGDTGELGFYKDGKLVDGLISKLTNQRNGNVPHADSAAVVMSLLSKEVIRNDFFRRNPSNKLTRASHQVATLAVADSLASSAQYYLQPTFALMGHVFFQGNKINWSFFSRYLTYNMKKFMEVPGRTYAAITGGDHDVRFDETSLTEKFIRDKSPYIFSRTPGANEMFLSDAGRDKPHLSLTPGSSLDKASRAIFSPFAAVKDSSLRGRGWLLDKTIGSAERSLIHPMFVDEVLRLKNEELVSEGESPMTREYFLLNQDTIDVSYGILSDAELAIDDLLGSSKQSKKARIFQPNFGKNGSGSASIEAARGVFTLFSSVSSALAANMYAARAIAKETKFAQNPEWTAEEEAEARRVHEQGRSEYARLMRTNLFQSVAYQVFKQNVVISLASWIASIGSDDPEERYEEILRAVYGLEDGVRQRNWYDPAHFVTSQLIGSDLPFGYDRKSDSFTDEKFNTDLKMMALRTSKELLGQQPFLHQGLLATSFGQFSLGLGLGVLMDDTLGGMPEYTRAGLIVPEWAGGDDEGPNSEYFHSRAIYSITKMMHNDLGDQSAMLAGMESIIAPFSVLSQARDDIEALDAVRAFATAIMPMTRDARRALNRDFEEQIDAKIWHSYWRNR